MKHCIQSLCTGLALSFVVCSATADKTTNDVSTATPEKRQAISVYRATCSYCHDHEGIAPKIRGRAIPPALTKTLVRVGLGAMPTFRKTEISDEELEALANWLSTTH